MQLFNRVSSLFVITAWFLFALSGCSSDDGGKSGGEEAKVAVEVEVPLTFTGDIFVNKANQSEYKFSGTCPLDSDTVVIELDAHDAIEVPCDQGLWVYPGDSDTLVNADFLTATRNGADGNIAWVTISVKDAESDEGVNDLFFDLTVDVILPTVPLVDHSQAVNIANQGAYMLPGTCSEPGTVTVKVADGVEVGADGAEGEARFRVVSADCRGGKWTAELELAGVIGADDGDGTNIESVVSFVDLAGNAMETDVSTSLVRDLIAPIVEGQVAVPADQDYRTTGEELVFTVTFSENVVVVGSPYIELAIDPISEGKRAVYKEGSGSKVLLFAYPLEDGLLDADGIELVAPQVVIAQGHTIRDGAGNDIVPDLGEIPSLAGVIVGSDWPRVGITRSGSAAVNGAFDISVSFSEDIEGFEFSELEAAIAVGFTGSVTVENFRAVSGRTFLARVVPAGALDGEVIIHVAPNAVRDSEGKSNEVGATLTVPVDIVLPRVVGVDAAPGDYKVGEEVLFTVTFSEDVVVAGTPKLSLVVGSVSRAAVYKEPDAQNAAVHSFGYVIAASDGDGDGVEVGRISFPANSSIKDVVDNGLNAHFALVTLAAVTVDTTAPQILSVSGTGGRYKVGDVIKIAVAFDEMVTVTGSPSLSLTVGSGSKAAGYDSVSSEGAMHYFTYSVVAGDSDDDGVAVTAIALNSGTIRDGAGNDAAALSAAVVISGVRIDTMAPQLAGTPFTAAAGSYRGGVVIPIKAHFNETVTLGAGASLTVNGSTAAYQGGGTANVHVFHYAVEGSDRSGVALNITGFTGTVSDIAGNAGDMASVSSSLGDVLLDTVRPSVSMTGPTGKESAAFDVTITFSESVKQFSPSGLVIANGSVARIEGGGTSYTASIVPGNGAGEVVVHLNANVALDAAGNGNSAASSLRVVVDHAGPGVSIVRRGTSATGPVNGNFDIAIEFSETLGDPSGSLDSEITVVNGAVVSGSGTWNSGRYEVVIGPSIASGKEGEVAVSVAAWAVQDRAGNGSEASNILRVFVDKRVPTILGIAAADGYYRTGDAVEIVVEFNEAVLVVGTAPSLVLTDVGSASYVGARNGTTHLFSYVVTGAHNDLDGLGASSLANYASFKDLAGNALPDPGSSLSISGTAIIDSTLPTVVDSTGNALADDATATQVKNWAWKCASEVGCKFRSVVNQNVNHSFGIESYTLTDSANTPAPNPPSNSETYYLHVQAQDLAGNESQVYRVSAVVDNKAPTVSFAGIASGARISSNTTLEVTFSESVKSGTALIADEITATGGAVTVGTPTLKADGNNTTFTVPINVVADKSNVPVTLTVASGAITDAAGNGNSVSVAHSFIVDTGVPDAPVLSLSNPSSSPSNDTTPTLALKVPARSTAKLYEGSGCTGTVMGTVANTTASAENKTITLAALNSDKTYNFYAQTEKTANATIKSGCSSALSYVLDTTGPTVAFSGIAARDRISSDANLIVTFNEDIKTDATLAVTEITETDSGSAITVGTPVRQGNTKVWHIPLTLAANVVGSSVTLQVDANAVQDLAGNGNTVSDSHTFTVDTVAPTVSFGGIASGARISSGTNLEVTFSESVKSGARLTVSEITVTGNAVTVGTPALKSSSTTIFTVPITVLARKSNVTVTLTVASGAITDAAGNGNSVSAAHSFIVDTGVPDRPTLSLSSPPSSPGNDRTPTLSLNVPARSTARLYKGNSCTGSSVASVVNATDDAVDKTIISADLGNDNTYNFYALIEKTADNTIKSACSAVLSYVLDTAAPTPTLSGISGTVGVDQILTVTFDETVSGFNAGDITIAAGSAAVTRGSLTAVTAGTVWTMPITLVANQDGVNVRVTIGAGAVTDDAGNSSAAGSLSFRVDNVLDMPTGLVLKTPSSSPGNDKTPTLTVQEAPGGRTITLHKNSACTDTALASVTTTGSSAVNKDITPTSDLIDGSYTFYVKITKVSASLSTCFATGVAYVLDTAKPVAIISGNFEDTTVTTTVEIRLSVSVGGWINESSFTADDITIDPIGAVTVGVPRRAGNSANPWIVPITPVAGKSNIQVTLSIAADRFTDNAGNGNVASSGSNLFTFTVNTAGRSSLLSEVTPAERPEELSRGEV